MQGEEKRGEEGGRKCRCCIRHVNVLLCRRCGGEPAGTSRPEDNHASWRAKMSSHFSISSENCGAFPCLVCRAIFSSFIRLLVCFFVELIFTSAEQKNTDRNPAEVNWKF